MVTLKKRREKKKIFSRKKKSKLEHSKNNNSKNVKRKSKRKRKYSKKVRIKTQKRKRTRRKKQNNKRVKTKRTKRTKRTKIKRRKTMTGGTNGQYEIYFISDKYSTWPNYRRSFEELVVDKKTYAVIKVNDADVYPLLGTWDYRLNMSQLSTDEFEDEAEGYIWARKIYLSSDGEMTIDQDYIGLINMTILEYPSDVDNDRSDDLILYLNKYQNKKISVEKMERNHYNDEPHTVKITYEGGEDVVLGNKSKDDKLEILKDDTFQHKWYATPLSVVFEELITEDEGNEVITAENLRLFVFSLFCTDKQYSEIQDLENEIKDKDKKKRKRSRRPN